MPTEYSAAIELDRIAHDAKFRITSYWSGQGLPTTLSELSRVFNKRVRKCGSIHDIAAMLAKDPDIKTIQRVTGGIIFLPQQAYDLMNALAQIKLPEYGLDPKTVARMKKRKLNQLELDRALDMTPEEQHILNTQYAPDEKYHQEMEEFQAKLDKKRGIK